MKNRRFQSMATALRISMARVVVCACMSLSMLPANGATQDLTLAQFNHRAWTNRDGAPVDAWAIAQTRDGWLWFGAPTGLYRFDGIQFEQVEIEGLDPRRSRAISALYASKSGALWIGYVHGGATLLNDGQFTQFGEAQGLSRGTVLAVAEDPRGGTWVASASELRHFDGRQWSAGEGKFGFPDKFARALTVDSRGTLWIAGEHDIYFLEPHSQAFQRSGIQLEGKYGGDFMTSADGRLWFVDDRGVRTLAVPATTGPQILDSNRVTSYLRLIDRAGNLWSTAKNKVSRQPFVATREGPLGEDSPAIDHFDAKDGLSGAVAKTMLEDLEGNVWVATDGGIDRFRQTNLRALPPDVAELGLAAMAPARDGAIWIGGDIGSFTSSSLEGLWKFDGRLQRVPVDGNGGSISAVELDADGNLWIGGPEGIWREDDRGHFRKYAELPEGSRGQDVRSLRIDRDGNPWISVVGAPLYRHRQGQWERNGNLDGLPDRRPAAVDQDREGRLWLGYARDDQLFVIESDHVRSFGTAEGLDVGRIFAIHAGTHTVVAGANRIAVLDGDRFHVVNTPADPAVLRGVADILESKNGDLWFNTFKGAVRVTADELDRAIANQTYKVAFELFDAEDGYPGIAPTNTSNSLIEGTDGRLWFIGSQNIAWMDPSNIRRNAVAPPLSIRTVTAAGQKHSTAQALSLAAGTRDLQFDYTALSFARPDRVRFRYRLDGFDSNWIEAGSRREAFYTNLDPGRYRFRIAAANESGMWNESGDSLDVAIPPTFVQTRWFVVLCVVAVLALSWVLYSLRIRAITRNLRHRLEERLGERERIARELHDTLLQGVQGLLLKFQTVTDEIPDNTAARKMMEEALDRADDVLIEGRDRVKALRMQPTNEADLPQAIDAIGEEQARNQPTRFILSVEGTPRPLDPIVREEVLRIAREALTNAFRHARAAKVEAEIIYDRAALKLRVRDDGCGIDGSILKTGRPDHWGLPGMRERARKLRASFEVWSRPGAGTEVALDIPARLAFTRQASRWTWWSGKLRPEL